MNFFLRDSIRDTSYFEEFLGKKNELIASGEHNISSGKLAEDKIERAKFRNFGFRLESLVARYSKGDSIESLKEPISDIIRRLPDESDPINTKVKFRQGGKTLRLDQYMVEPYERMLRLLSLAYLLNVSDSDFETIVRVIDRDNVSDVLYESIIRARIPGRVQEKEEEYDPRSVILKVYKNLREAVVKSDLSESAKLVKKFLEKDFYHKDSGFYDFHKSKINLYYGYWSFEAAAITCIKGLDDSSYRDQQYYPKDLADYCRLKNQPRDTLKC